MVKKTNWLMIALDSFIRPKRALRTIKENPKWIWLLFAVLFAASFILQLVASTPAPQTHGVNETIAIVILGPFVVFEFTLVFIVWISVWAAKGALAHLVSRFWGEKTSFMAMFSALGLMYIPFAVWHLAEAAITVAIGRINVIQYLSLSYFVTTKEPPSVFAPTGFAPAPLFLSRISVFSLWSMYLFFLALVICGGLSKKKAILTAVAFWGIFTLIEVLEVLTKEWFLLIVVCGVVVSAIFVWRRARERNKKLSSSDLMS